MLWVLIHMNANHIRKFQTSVCKDIWACTSNEPGLVLKHQNCYHWPKSLLKLPVTSKGCKEQQRWGGRCWNRWEETRGHMICCWMLGLCVYTLSICRIFDGGVKGLKWRACVTRSHSTPLKASGKHEDFKIIFACLVLLSGLQTQRCILPQFHKICCNL